MVARLGTLVAILVVLTVVDDVVPTASLTLFVLLHTDTLMFQLHTDFFKEIY